MTRTFFNQTTNFAVDFTIERQVYVGNKSSFSTLATATGHFKQLEEETAALNGFQFGKAFKLEFEADIDLQDTDRVIIDSVTYNVQGVVPNKRGSVPFKTALLTQPERR